MWVQSSLRAPIRSRRAGEKGRRPLSAFHRSPDFPCHAPAASDLGSGGRLSWKRPPFHSYGSWGCPGGYFGTNPRVPTTYLWGSVPRPRGATAGAGAGAREALPPPPQSLPPHTGIRSAAQHSPCRAPASDWRRSLPPEPERTANEMLMRCAKGGVRADQSWRREPNPALGGLDPSPTPPPGACVRPRARAT